jgi:predicted transcriptional regulator
MPNSPHATLTRRERQIVDILYRRGRATAAEVMADLPGEPSDSTVRTQLRVLEDKGHVRHEEEGLRYIYLPAVPRHAVRKSALRHLVDTFFEGSAEKVVAALLGEGTARLSDDELDRMAQRIARARKGATAEPPDPSPADQRLSTRARRKDGSK